MYCGTLSILTNLNILNQFVVLFPLQVHPYLIQSGLQFRVLHSKRCNNEAVYDSIAHTRAFFYGSLEVGACILEVQAGCPSRDH